MNIPDLLKQGELLFSQGKTDEAEEIFLRVIEHEPDNKEAHNNLGVVAFSRGDAEGAVIYFKKAVDSDPHYLDALVNLCEVLQSKGSMAEALPYIERAIALNPESESLCAVLKDGGATICSEEGKLISEEKGDGVVDPKKSQKEIRVIHLPLVIANTALALSKYLNRIGVDSKVISYFRTWLNYEGDINLELDNISGAGRNRKVAAFVDDFLQNEAHKYDIFHFHFFDSLSTGSSFGGWRSHPDREPYWDLEYIKNLGKKIVVSSWGSDVRNNSKVVYSQLQFEQAVSEIPYPPLNRKDQYFKIWAFARYADVIVHGDTEVVDHAPHGTMIPILIDLEPFEQLLHDVKSEDAGLSIVYAPTNHFFKGTAYVENVLKKIADRYGERVEIRRVHGIPHQEAVLRYLGKGITIDQIGSFSFGLFALESLYLGRTVVTSLRRGEFFGDDPKLQAPIIPVTNEADFLETVVRTIESGALNKGPEYREYVRDNFGADIVASKYKALYEQLMAGERIAQYVGNDWYGEFNSLISNRKIDLRDYYPKVTDLLLTRGDFEKLEHEVQMGLGLNDDVELLAKYIVALELTNRDDAADVMKKNNKKALSSNDFRRCYRRARELYSKGKE